MRKIIVMILTCMIVLTGAATAYAAEFTDVGPKHWAYEAVSAMSDKTIIKGYPDGSFQPSNTITYGEFIKMALIAATGEDAGNATAGNWALNYYNKALELGYFTAYDIDQSNLNQQITRAHMALIISSILGDVKIDDYDEIQKGITDIDYKTKYEYDITKAYASGILTGYTDNTFRPEKTLSRAEAATVIYRLVDESKRILPGAQNAIEDRAQNGASDSGTINLAESSTSTLLLDDIVSNRGNFDFLLRNVKYYEIINNYPYTMTKWVNYGGIETIKISNVDNSSGAFLIQGDKLIQLSDGAGQYYWLSDSKAILNFDYIGFYNSNYDTMILVPNPF